ncbi:hypothetical protein F7R21_04180 [Burkholderia latens]|uniref:Acyl-CoA dehydrogenase n=3 Tax=Burkholderia latens TaxID=488446 RepID=A0A6H9TGT9_9BURK|nr:hypothetical protein [Burkholderia latens]KAB0644196.1 hypothetical protein F7R21_04180 [Burkholderia latens]VWB43792.1 acyl-CoA dehydrogenase [Burkholderia latens]
MHETSWWPALDSRHSAICDAVRDHVPVWERRAVAAERSKRLPSETYAELHACGVLELFSPLGSVSDTSAWPTLVEASRIAARGCASTGWMIAMLGGHAAIAMRTGANCVRQLYRNGVRQRFASASAGPQSRLSYIDGGIHVTGRWRFSSGIEDATWLMLNAPCSGYPGVEPGDKVVVLVERRHVRPLASWQASGMCATGSQDVEIDHLADVGCATPLAELFGVREEEGAGEYLHVVPVVPYVTTSIVGPLVGAAEGAYDAWLATLRDSSLTDAKARDRAAERVGHAAAELAAVRLMYVSLIGRLHDAGVARRALDATDCLALRRDRAYLANRCVDIVRRIVERAGASTFTSENTIQRRWRDIQVMAAHRDVAWETAMTQYGESMLTQADVMAPSSGRANS